jgi:hypothetical protein
LHLFRHIAQKCSAIHKVLPALFRQSDEKSDGAIAQQSLCGVALKIKIYIVLIIFCRMISIILLQRLVSAGLCNNFYRWVKYFARICEGV